MSSKYVVISLSCFALFGVANVRGQESLRAATAAGAHPASASEIPAAQLIQPEELVATLRSAKSPKPLVFQVGFRVLYVQAHIPGSEYVAAGSSAEGIRQLRARAEKLPRNTAIVLYCGCCPGVIAPMCNPRTNCCTAWVSQILEFSSSRMTSGRIG
jgi:hypothetical protein